MGGGRESRIPRDHARKRAQSTTVLTAFDNPMPLSLRYGKGDGTTSYFPLSAITDRLYARNQLADTNGSGALYGLNIGLRSLRWPLAATPHGRLKPKMHIASGNGKLLPMMVAARVPDVITQAGKDRCGSKAASKRGGAAERGVLLTPEQPNGRWGAYHQFWRSTGEGIASNNTASCGLSHDMRQTTWCRAIGSATDERFSHFMTFLRSYKQREIERK